MNKIHLSTEQANLLKIYKKLFKKRPSRIDYETFRDLLLIVNVGVKPKIKNIPNTTKGYSSGEVKLLPNFDALKDLPPGWAVKSRFDSGGNHIISNAADVAWKDIWNYWK